MDLVTVSLMFGWGCSFTLLFTSLLVIYIFLKTEEVIMEEEFIEHEVTVTITISTHIDIEDWEEACEHLENDLLEKGIGDYNAEFEFSKS